MAQFDAIIFSNTSGNAILNADQRANFVQWVADGGHVLGIHAASDTYRHSTANGNNTGTWDFYPELIGASVQENPNHVNGTPTYTLQRVGAHPSTYNVPDQWVKAEEYYYWENGYFAELNTATLIVEETVGPNGQVNSYDAPRPMSWYRTTGYSRIFYTALGTPPRTTPPTSFSGTCARCARLVVGKFHRSAIHNHTTNPTPLSQSGHEHVDPDKHITNEWPAGTARPYRPRGAY